LRTSPAVRHDTGIPVPRPVWHRAALPGGRSADSRRRRLATTARSPAEQLVCGSGVGPSLAAIRAAGGSGKVSSARSPLADAGVDVSDEVIVSVRGEERD